MLLDLRLLTLVLFSCASDSANRWRLRAIKMHNWIRLCSYNPISALLPIQILTYLTGPELPLFG